MRRSWLNSFSVLRGCPSFVDEMSTEAQKKCRLQLDEDYASAESFIDENWPVQSSGKVKSDSMVSYTVSTTLKSSVLLVAVGSNSAITINTFSKDRNNPWLIRANMVLNPNLANDVREKWANMQVPEGKREEVDQIIPHVVYSIRDERCWCWRWRWRWWELVPLTCDDSPTVKVVVGDMKIYSHPPRDEPLKSALEKQEGFDQKKGSVKAAIKKWQKISENDKIPEDIKPQRLAHQVNVVKEIFTEFYEDFYVNFFKDPHNIPTSYRLPTLQLQLLPDGGNQEQRYGGTFSGVYGSTANEVHHPYAAAHVKPRPVPGAKTVYKQLKDECPGSTLDYDVIFGKYHLWWFLGYFLISLIFVKFSHHSSPHSS